MLQVLLTILLNTAIKLLRIDMNKSYFLMIIFFTLPLSSFAEETKLEKIETQKNEAVDAMKKNVRGLKDKSCHLMNGKMVCLGRKIKHKMKNIIDESKTKTNEEKNKVSP